MELVFRRDEFQPDFLFFLNNMRKCVVVFVISMELVSPKDEF